MDHVIIPEYALLIDDAQAKIISHCAYYYEDMGSISIVRFSSREAALEYATTKGYAIIIQDNIEDSD